MLYGDDDDDDDRRDEPSQSTKVDAVRVRQICRLVDCLTNRWSVISVVLTSDGLTTTFVLRTVMLRLLTYGEMLSDDVILERRSVLDDYAITTTTTAINDAGIFPTEYVPPRTFSASLPFLQRRNVLTLLLAYRNPDSKPNRNPRVYVCILVCMGNFPEK